MKGVVCVLRELVEQRVREWPVLRGLRKEKAEDDSPSGSPSPPKARSLLQ